MAEDTDPRQRLRTLLCERPEYSSAYWSSPEFKSAVDALVALIPHILAAAYSSGQDSQADRTKAMIRAMKPAPWFVNT